MDKRDPRLSAEKRRVLVVDDCPDIAESLAAVLEINGLDTRNAFGPSEALGIFLAWRPLLAFVDVCMPDINGFEACRRMRAAARHEAALIEHTALGASETRAEAIAAGFDAYVGKPISPAGLVAAIEVVCPIAAEWAVLRRRAIRDPISI